MSKVEVYNVSKLLHADEPFFFHAKPDSVFIFSPDVLGDQCHVVQYHAINRADWEKARAEMAAQDPDSFGPPDMPRLPREMAYRIMKEQAFEALERLAKGTGDKSEAQNFLTTLCVLHKVINPDSKVGLSCAERCGNNVLEAYAQAVNPQKCQICDRLFINNGGIRNIIDVDLWKNSGNCKCEDIKVCKECLFEHITAKQTKIVDSVQYIGDELVEAVTYLCRCPLCDGQVIVDSYVAFMNKVMREYEEHLAQTPHPGCQAK